MIGQKIETNKTSVNDRLEKVKDGLSSDITETRAIIEQNRKDAKARMTRLEEMVENRPHPNTVPSVPQEVLLLEDDHLSVPNTYQAKSLKHSLEVTTWSCFQKPTQLSSQ